MMPTPRDLSKLTYIDSNNFSVNEAMIGRRDAYVSVSYPLSGMACDLRFGTRMDVATPTTNVDGWVMQPPMIGGYNKGRQLQFFFDKPFGRKVPSHTALYEVSRQFLFEADAWIDRLVAQEVSERNAMKAAAMEGVYTDVIKRLVSEAYFAAEAAAKPMIDYDARRKALEDELRDETLRQIGANIDMLTATIRNAREFETNKAVQYNPEFRAATADTVAWAINDAVFALESGQALKFLLPRLRL